MKKYMSFFRLRFAMGLQYRTAAWAGIVTQFAWGSMEILMFHAFYRANPSAFPMSFPATASYIWFQQAFLALFASWMLENEIFDSIMDGSVAYELCRPMNIYHMWFFRSMAYRLSRAVLRCMPILLVAMILPDPLRLVLPKSPGIFLAFLITMILAALVTAAFSCLIYILTYFTVSTQGFKLLLTSLMELLTGAIIPIAFLPDGMKRVLEFLPFSSMQNVPLRIYSGDLAGAAAWRAGCLQFFWLAALILLGNGLCRLAVRRVTLQGG